MYMKRFIMLLISLLLLLFGAVACNYTGAVTDSVVDTSTDNSAKEPPVLAEDGDSFAVGEDSKILISNSDNSVIAITFTETEMSVWCQENSCTKPQVIEPKDKPEQGNTKEDIISSVNLYCEVSLGTQKETEAIVCDDNSTIPDCDKEICKYLYR